MSKPLLVMKFGGTSVGSPERIACVAELCARAAEDYSLVVTSSAMSKVTDLLLATLSSGEDGDEATVEANLAALEKQHVAAARELLPADRLESTLTRIREFLARYARIARGMLLLRDRPARSVDEAIAVGEKLSCLLIVELLESRGIAAEWVDGSQVIVTDAVCGGASPLMEETATAAAARLHPPIAEGRIPVVTGFNGATADGQLTTLGRGGTDFSASILAAALSADELWIWTDVDGILSGDPRMVADARVLPAVTYNEAAELAYNGAKVLHPKTLQPVVDKAIPVWIKNSFRPEQPGTKISNRVSDPRGVRAITSLPHVTLLSIEAVSLSQSGAQLMSRALAAAARAKVEVLLLTRSSFRQNFCLLVRTDEVHSMMDSLREELSLELAHDYVHPIEIDHSVGLVATVGEGMKGMPGLARDIFTAMAEKRVNIIAIAQGSSELTIAVVVRQSQLEDAVCAIHAGCGLGQASAPETAAVGGEDQLL